MLMLFSNILFPLTISCFSVCYTFELIKVAEKDYIVFYFIVAYVGGWKVIPADTLYWDKKTE